MSWRERVRAYFTARGIRGLDVVLLVVVLVAAFLCTRLSMPIEEALSTRESFVVGHSAKQGPDGLYYVIDSGHSRLLCFDEEGRIRHVLDESPTGGPLYIDSIDITDQGFYVSATEWDGMAIANEAVYAYDSQGAYLETVAFRDYTGNEPNKHRFHAVDAGGDNGSVRIAECYDGSIRVGAHEYDFENAFNAVYNAVFVKDTLYVLSKDRCIYALDLSDPAATFTVAYDARAAGEGDCVPYYLTADAQGNLFYLDVKGATVRAVDLQTKTSSVAWAETASLSVNVAQNGDFLLMEGGGLLVGERGSGGVDQRGALYMELEKSPAQIASQVVFVLSAVVLVIAGLILLGHVGFNVVKYFGQPTHTVAVWVLTSVAIVSVVLSGSLLNSFRESYQEKIEEQTLSTAYMVANQMNGDLINQVEETGGFGGTGYQALIDIMERSFPMSVEFFRLAYCNVLVLDEGGQTAHAVAYLDQAIGDYLPLDPIETAEVAEVYRTGRASWNKNLQDISGTYTTVKVPVYGDGEIVGVVAVGVETYVIDATLSEMQKSVMLSTAVILMLLWLVLNEVIAYVTNRNLYVKDIRMGDADALPGHHIRLLVFLVFAVYNMTATFLPGFLLRRADIFPEQLQGFLGALPITVNIFLIGVMSLFCAGLIRRMGFRRVMLVAALCSFAGNAVIFLMPSYATIALGLVLDGIGVGLITNAIYILITYIKDDLGRTWGLAVYNSAYLSGINCGMLLGSLVAAHLGQELAFLFVALDWLVLLAVSAAVVRAVSSLLDSGAQDEGQDASEVPASIPTGRFVLSRPVASLILLIQNPYIVFGSFVFYYVPLFCDAAGMSETICSLLILLYSEVAILSGSSLTRAMRGTFGHRSIYVALGINVAALAVFVLVPNLWGMAVALVLLGLSAAFGKPMQQSFFLDLEQARAYGEDRAMGIYNFSENIGESLGPLVIGRVVSGAPAAAFLGIVSACGLGHFLLNRKEMKGSGDE